MKRFGTGAADDLLVEVEARSARARRDLQLHVSELAVAAGLPLQPRRPGRRRADRLPERDRAHARCGA
jgi:hypothetical protein